jgi:hypothetical protein
VDARRGAAVYRRSEVGSLIGPMNALGGGKRKAFLGFAMDLNFRPLPR